MWKSLIRVSILCSFRYTLVLGALIDQAGDSLTELNPTIPEDVKEESRMNAVRYY